MKMRSKRTLRDRLFEANAKLPRPVQRHTDRAIKAGHKASKIMRPVRKSNQRKGKAWVKDKKRKIIKRLGK